MKLSLTYKIIVALAILASICFSGYKIYNEKIKTDFTLQNNISLTFENQSQKLISLSEQTYYYDSDKIDSFILALLEGDNIYTPYDYSYIKNYGDSKEEDTIVFMNDFGNGKIKEILKSQNLIDNKSFFLSEKDLQEISEKYDLSSEDKLCLIKTVYPVFVKELISSADVDYKQNNNNFISYEYEIKIKEKDFYNCIKDSLLIIGCSEESLQLIDAGIFSSVDEYNQFIDDFNNIINNTDFHKAGNFEFNIGFTKKGSVGSFIFVYDSDSCNFGIINSKESRDGNVFSSIKITHFGNTIVDYKYLKQYNKDTTFSGTGELRFIDYDNKTETKYTAEYSNIEDSVIY